MSETSLETIIKSFREYPKEKICNELKKDGCEKKLEKFLKFKKKSKNVLVYMGLCYQFVEKNYPEMIKCYDLAVEKKDEDAMCYLGEYYQFVVEDYDMMKCYYNMIVENGRAFNNFGYYYEEFGYYDEAVDYYNKAIALDDSNAMNNMGEYYCTVEKDYKKGLAYYEKAFSKNNKAALRNLVDYHKKNKNSERVATFLSIASQNDDDEAMVELGDYYFENEKYNRYEEMKKYYVRASKLNNSEALYKLGYHSYAHEKNYKKMKKYYLSAIEKGNSKAMWKLGEFYYKRKYYEKAKKYLSMAKKAGCEFDDEDDVIFKINKSEKEIFERIVGDVSVLDYEFFENGKCAMCQQEYKIMFNFKCHGKLNHYHCIMCCKEIYVADVSKEPHDCCTCSTPLDTDNLKLALKRSPNEKKL